MGLKKEARVIGIDDAPFEFKRDKTCLVIGVITRGREYLDGVLSCHIRVDGTDATQKFADMINYSHFRDQLRVIFLDGISYAGFNMVNIKELHELTKIPVVVVIRKNPNKDEFLDAMKRLKDWQERARCVEIAGSVEKLSTNRGTIYFQFYGCDRKKAEEFIKKSLKRAAVPECLRMAHIIARGVVAGESGKGR